MVWIGCRRQSAWIFITFPVAEKVEKARLLTAKDCQKARGREVQGGGSRVQGQETQESSRRPSELQQGQGKTGQN